MVSVSLELFLLEFEVVVDLVVPWKIKTFSFKPGLQTATRVPVCRVFAGSIKIIIPAGESWIEIPAVVAESHTL